MSAGDREVRSLARRLLSSPDHPHQPPTIGRVRGLSGGRNNRLFACQTDDGEVCVKLYLRDGVRRARHEWAALSVLAAAGIDAVPHPIGVQLSPTPAVAMTLLPGHPQGGAPLTVEQIRQLADLFAVLHAITPDAVPGPVPRVRLSVAPMLAEVRHRWSACDTDDATPVRKDLRLLWQDWAAGPAPALLSRPTPAVFGHGDPNPSNCLWDGSRVRLVDFEYAGWSDPHHEAALLVEHVQSRTTPDATWSLFEDLACPDEADRTRVHAARGLVAWFWTMEFWPTDEIDSTRFADQADRLHHVLLP